MSALGGRAAASGVGPSKMSSAEMNVSFAKKKFVHMYTLINNVLSILGKKFRALTHESK